MRACTEENIAVLLNEISLYDLELTYDQATLLLKHLDLVIEKNKVMNLTRIVTIQEAIDKHIVDSLLILKVIENKRLLEGKKPGNGRFLDIGSGAGYPGIPLAITTSLQGTLIDSVGKKVKAIQEFIEHLGLSNAHAEHIRAEELAKTTNNSFGLIVARAVAETAVLMEYAAPLLPLGGQLIVTEALPSEEELQHAQAVEDLLGLHSVSRETFELPNESGMRTIITYEKTSKEKIKLPRNTGMAKHHPLYEGQ